MAGQSAAEHAARAKEARLEGGVADAEGAGGVAVGKLPEIAELNGVSVPGVEAVDGGEQQAFDFVTAAGFLGGLAGMREIEGEGVGFVVPLVFERDKGVAALQAEPAAGGVDDDGVQPGIDAGFAAEVRKVGEGLEDGLLDDVLGILLAVGEAQGDADQDGAAALDGGDEFVTAIAGGRCGCLQTAGGQQGRLPIPHG